MDLSPDQETALSACLVSIKANRETVLVGVAGSGKTTLMNALIAQTTGRVVLACPTGKAAHRLAQVTGRTAVTIHRLLYRSVEEVGDELVFSEPHAPCLSGDLIVVDEASMVGSRIYRELMKYLPDGARVLWVGDSEQLEPVNDDWGPDLRNPTARLTEVHRQALGNPIIAYATAVRQGEGNEWLKTDWNPEDGHISVEAGAHPAMVWYLSALDRGADVTLVTFTHKVRRAFNESVRANMKVDGKKLAPGDKILVKTNRQQAGLMNGQVLTVKSLSRLSQRYRRDPVFRVLVREQEGAILVNTDLIEKQPRDFWNWYKALPDFRKDHRLVHIWYGNCLTVHSSQGSQWDEVGFLWDDSFKRMRTREKEGARRFLYTAITRAAEKLAIFSI